MERTEVTFRGVVCVLEFENYSNGRIAIDLVEKSSGDMYATATINLPGYRIESDEAFIKDYSENYLTFIFIKSIFYK